ncbi:MAG: 5-(carboxyamino)imidazole ribonucleotide mutase [Rhodospirillaceae bacterium]|nr:5-(carboxyamino)imidazole ribonucleotide mutase [Rhodospirillaceae bacterium]
MTAKDQPLSSTKPVVGVVMGSQSDWTTMRNAAIMLGELDISHETKILSAHRTPKRMTEYAETAGPRGLKIIIAGAGGAAHLPGMIAAQTMLPVLGVPIESKALGGVDSLLSIVQMPKGVPVGTLAIGANGAINAALLAASILSISDPNIAARLAIWRTSQTQSVADTPNESSC